MADNSLLGRGIDWFNVIRKEQENASPDKEVIIRGPGGIERTVSATVIEPETVVNNRDIKVQTDKYIFLIDAQDLVGFRIVRGVQFIRRGVFYEAIIDNKSLADYNDPNNTTVAIAAQKRPYSPII